MMEQHSFKNKNSRRGRWVTSLVIAVSLHGATGHAYTDEWHPKNDDAIVSQSSDTEDSPVKVWFSGQEGEESDQTFQQIVQVDEAPIGLALALNQTLENDIVMRITNKGFDFLGRQIQALLYGWAPRSEVDTKAVETIPAVLNEELLGLKAGFELLGIANACIMLGNNNNDDGRFSYDNGGAAPVRDCSCNVNWTDPGHNPPYYDTDCPECWIQADDTGHQAHPPNGWTSNNGRKACELGGADGDGGGSATATKNLAYYSDPAKEGSSPKYWCKGPFYDTAIKFDVDQIDPDCLKRDPADASFCPIVGTSNNDCDEICEFWKGPLDSDTEARNDVEISIAPLQAQQLLRIDATLHNVILDLVLAVGNVPTASGCHIVDTGAVGTGSFLNPKKINFVGDVAFLDGRNTGMLGSDGDSFSASGGGGSGGPPPSCAVSANKGACCADPPPSGSSGGGIAAFTPEPLVDAPTLGVDFSVGDFNISPPVDVVSEVDLDIYNHCDFWSEPLCGIVCGTASLLLDPILALIGPLIEDLVNDMVKDAVKGLIGDEVAKLIEDELGLPIDFTALLGGQPSLAKETCALRLPTAANHVKRMDCSHTTDQEGTPSPWNPMNCGSGAQACSGYGNCPCDDFDNDGLFNYQDAVPFGPGSGEVEFNGTLSSGQPDCNHASTGGAVANLWCGAPNTTPTENYYSWQHGIGSFFPDEGGIYYNSSLNADMVWDSSGFNIVLDVALVPWRSHPVAPPAGQNVTFYYDTNYGGTAVAYSTSQNSLGGHDNDFSSVKVPEGVRLTVFDGTNQNGVGMHIVKDDPTFVDNNANDAISSFRIEQIQDNPYQGEIPDPNGVHGGSGKQWDVYLAEQDPTSKSCYYGTFGNSGPGNLWLDSTDRDNDINNREGASVTPVNRWLVGRASGGVDVEYKQQSIGLFLASLDAHTGGLDSLDVALAKAGDRIVSGGTDGRTKMYHNTGSSWDLKGNFVIPGGANVGAVAISPTGNYAAAGSVTGMIEVYRWDSGGDTWVTHTRFIQGTLSFAAGTDPDTCDACGGTCNTCVNPNCSCETCNLGTNASICGANSCASGINPTDYSVCGCRDCRAYSGDSSDFDSCGCLNCNNSHPDSGCGCTLNVGNCDCGSCGGTGSCSWGGTSGCNLCNMNEPNCTHPDAPGNGCASPANGNNGNNGFCNIAALDNCRTSFTNNNFGLPGEVACSQCAWDHDAGAGTFPASSCEQPEDCSPCQPGMSSGGKCYACEFGPLAIASCRACNNPQQIPPLEVGAGTCPNGLCAFGCELHTSCPDIMVDGVCPTCGVSSCGPCSGVPADGHDTTGQPILDIKWHPSDDEYIVSSSGDGSNSVYLWNPTEVRRWRQTYEFPNGSKVVSTDARTANAVAWNGSGERLAFAYSDGNIDKIYAVEQDSTPFDHDGVSYTGDRDALRWQGPSSAKFTCAASDVAWLDEFVYVASSTCVSPELVVNNANLAYNTASVGTETQNPAGGVAGVAYVSDGSVVYIRGTQVRLWNGITGGSDALITTHGSTLNSISANSGGDFDKLFDDWDFITNANTPDDGEQHHFTFLTSQQFLAELIYSFYYGGIFCIDFTAGDNDFVDEFLEVGNLRGVIPYLGDIDDNGQFVWAQNEPVQVQFRPKDLPIVKVLGGRLNDCFPDGDLIPSSGVIESRVDDANFQVHDLSGAGACAAPLESELAVYDLMIYLPNYEIEFMAPLSNGTGPPYTMQHLFTQELHLGMAAAIEYSFSANPTPFATENRFFEILIDAFVGCGGDLFSQSLSTFTVDHYGGLDDNCGITVAPLPFPANITEGVSDVIHTLLNGTLSVLIQGKLTLAGLNIDFYKIGAGTPIEGDGPDTASLDKDLAGFGKNTPDFLVGVGRFSGALDFSALFGILGAPPLNERAIDTKAFIMGTGDSSYGFVPSNVFDADTELSIGDSYLAGAGENGFTLALETYVNGAEPDLVEEHVRYSWRLAPTGNWRPYAKGDRLRLPRMLTGHYTVEIKSRVPGQMVDETPASVSFFVDRVSPDIRVMSADGQYLPNDYSGQTAEGPLEVLASDNMSAVENMDVMYQIDGGGWFTLDDDRYIPEDLLFGDRKVKSVVVRATDEFDNERIIKFDVDNGDGGCGVGGNTGSDATMLLLMFFGWFLLKQSPRRNRRRLAVAALLCVLILPDSGAAATPFEVEFGNKHADQDEIVPVGDIQNLGSGIGYAAPITANDLSFYLFLDSQDAGPLPHPPTAGNDCKGKTDAQCLSLTAWLERTLDTLLQYRPMQDALQGLINSILDPGAQDVCFYTNTGYGGNEYCTKTDSTSMGPSNSYNNDFQSVVIPDGMIAYVYNTGAYGGFLSKITQDVSNLGTLGASNNISSIRTTWRGVALLDETLDIPLIGAFNLGMHFKDLWGNSNSAEGLLSGPESLTDNTFQIAQFFADDDDLALDIVQEILIPGNYEIRLLSTGVPDAAFGGQDLGNRVFDGSLELQFRLLQPLDLDVVFQQPSQPQQTESGEYLHAGGKMRLDGVDLVVRIYTAAGSLRELVSGRQAGDAAGYDVGIGLEYIKLKGSIDMNLDAFDCWHDSNVTLQFCDATQLSASHTQSGSQNEYEDSTNLKSNLLGDAISYLEAHMVYEADRTSGQAVTYLTALSLLDLRDLSHIELASGNYDPPALDHPLVLGDSIEIDYSLFWRFNAQADGAEKGSVLLPGGFGLQVSYVSPSFCSTNNPKPAAAGASSLSLPVATVDQISVAKDGRDSMFGFGVQLGPLNEAIDFMWEQDVACAAIDEDTPFLGELLGGILNTDDFRGFMPGMDQNLSGRKMQMRMIPRYVALKDVADADSVFNSETDQPKVKFCDPTMPCSPQGAVVGDNGPYDIHMSLPHMELQFLVDDENPLPNFTPMFSLEISVNVWVGVGFFQVSPESFPEIQGGKCGGTDSGCRAIRFSVAASSEVSRFYEYNSALNPVLQPENLDNAVSQIIALILSGLIEGNAEIVTNLASESVIGMTIDPVSNGTIPAGWEYGQGLESIDLIADADPRPQYLGLYLRMSDYFGSYGPYGTATATIPDGLADIMPPQLLFSILGETGIFDDVEGFSTGGFLAPAIPRRPQQQIQTSVLLIDLPQTEYYGNSIELDALQTLDAGLLQPSAKIELSALVAGDDQEVRYQYQVDNGLFQYAIGNEIPVPYLFDGRHEIKAWAIDRQGRLSQPGELILVVDRVGPAIHWIGDTDRIGDGREIAIGLEVVDRVSSADSLEVSWRVDEGQWTSVKPDGIVSGRVNWGTHVLEVRATDESGNQTTRSLAFEANGHGGCSTNGTQSTSMFLLLSLMIIAHAGYRIRYRYLCREHKCRTI